MKLIEGTIEIVKETLGSGEDVLVSGFGRFHVRDKGPRNGWNPKTGEGITIAPRRVVTFHAAADLRNRCKARVDPKKAGGDA